MAHRSDLVQVHRDFPLRESAEKALDPQCGKKLTHKEAQSVLFRKDETLYFCSRKCREDYQNRRSQSVQAA